MIICKPSVFVAICLAPSKAFKTQDHIIIIPKLSFLGIKYEFLCGDINVTQQVNLKKTMIVDRCHTYQTNNKEVSHIKRKLHFET